MLCSGDKPALAAKSLPVDKPIGEPDIEDIPDVPLCEPDIVVELLLCVGIVLVVCPTAVTTAPVNRVNERARLKKDCLDMTRKISDEQWIKVSEQLL